jgi:hypothetical protein
VSVYSETMYARIASTAQYGPSGAFTLEEKPVISCANPLLTAQEVATICTPANLTANQTLCGLPLDTNLASAEFKVHVPGPTHLQGVVGAHIRTARPLVTEVQQPIPRRNLAAGLR